MLSKDFYTPPLRFATQNIGEVACSDGGVKKYPQQRKRIKVSTLSPEKSSQNKKAVQSDAFALSLCSSQMR